MWQLDQSTNQGDVQNCTIDSPSWHSPNPYSATRENLKTNHVSEDQVRSSLQRGPFIFYK